MTNEEKINHLKESPLFNSLLSGDEIRYSDLIGHFIEKFKFNPFIDEENLTKEYIIHREKKYNTDLWINLIRKNRDGIRYEIPCILIENKLKSLINRDKLKDYTEYFIKDFIESFKNVLLEKNLNWINITKPRLFEYQDEIKSKLKELKFFTLTPIAEENNVSVTINVSNLNNGNDYELNFNWENISYENLGKRILSFINKNSIIKVLKSIIRLKFCHGEYMKYFYKDFAIILRSFSIISSDLGQNIFDEPIQKAFVPTQNFKDLGLEVLYAKIRASQCANQLSKVSSIGISDTKYYDMKVGASCVSHSFYNDSGIFTVMRKIESNLTYVIQYENGVLRKGLVIPINEASRYSDWLLKSWTIIRNESETIIEFKNKDGNNLNDEKKFNSYKEKDQGYKFYYSKFSVNQYQLTVNDIISIMADQINDESISIL